MTSSVRSSVDDLVAVIDPAMTARLIQLANAAHYGQGGRVSALHDAVLLLGFSTVRAAAMSACLAKGFGESTERFDPQRFWFFSVVVAELCQLISTAHRRHLDEAFTAGVVHGIGRLALIQSFPNELGDAQRAAEEEHLSLAETERQMFGFTDAELGGALATRWEFPPSLVEAIASHQLEPRAHEPSDSLAADVARAYVYTRAYGLTDGIETRRRDAPDPEWFTAPLSTTLAKAGKMPALRDTAKMFVEGALGVQPI